MPIPLYLYYGPTGSGKGTQARRLAEMLGYTTISTGDILREMQHQPGPHQQVIRDILQSGGLAPSPLMKEIVAAYLAGFKGKGLILDGAIRTLTQAEYLEATLPDDYFQPVMVHFLLGEQQVCERLLGPQGRCREDDTPENVRSRMEAYEANRGGLVAFYRSLNRYQEFSADDYPDRITKDLLRWVSAYEKRRIPHFRR